MTPMKITWGAITLGKGVRRATSFLTGTLRSLPKRSETEYIVHDWILAGFVSCLSGDVDAIVEVGAVPASEPVEPADDALEGEEAVMAGEGDTMETGAVELDDDGVVDVDADAVVLVDDDDPLEDVAGPGLGLSLGTPLANGSRAMRASTTFTGSADGVVVLWSSCGRRRGSGRRRHRRGGAGGRALEQEHGGADDSHDQDRNHHPQLALHQISTQRAHPCPPVVVPAAPASW